ETLNAIAAQNGAVNGLIALMNANAPKEDGSSWTWRESLTWLQQLLIGQGYMAEGAPVGLFDMDTRLAIEAFQRDHGLDGGNPDYRFGILDETTLACIAQM
ncbi:MAG: peptidoglycan-binding protein, partial [Clostridia bacterium]|nr:peptidoglycan-binding protein [Clostridia bacterium]